MIDLAPFCSTDPERLKINLPFHFEDRTYATNGHILVHVPLQEGIQTGEGVDPTRVLDACSFADLRPVPLRRLPALRYRLETDDLFDCRALVPMSGDIDGVPYDLFYIYQLFSLEGLRIGRPRADRAPLPFAADGDLYGALMPLGSPCPLHFANLIEVAR